MNLTASYGLYNMSGNVAEWTTAFDETVYDFSWDLAPEYVYHAKVDDPPALKRKVIRGGSWKDIGYYCQTGCVPEYSDTAKAYIGFRSVMSYLEKSDCLKSGTNPKGVTETTPFTIKTPAQR